MATFSFFGPNAFAGTAGASVDLQAFTLFGTNGGANGLSVAATDQGDFSLFGPNGLALSTVIGPADPLAEPEAPILPEETGPLTFDVTLDEVTAAEIDPFTFDVSVLMLPPGNVGTLTFDVRLYEVEQVGAATLDVALTVVDSSALGDTSQAWTTTVMLGDTDITDLITSAVTVDCEEGLARVAKFSYYLYGAIAPATLVSQTVTVDYIMLVDAVPALTVRLFTGIVDVPEFDPTTNRIAILATDNLSNVLGQQTRAAINQLIGGLWSQFIFNPQANSLQYAQDQMLTVPKSLDMDAYQQLRSTTWEAKATADFDFDESNSLDGSAHFQLSNRTSVKNKYEVIFEYRYPRLKYRTTTVIWTIGRPLSELFLKQFTLPTRQMISSAAGNLQGWEVLTVGFTPPPPTQVVSLPGGHSGIWICSPFMQAQLAWEAGYGIGKRWAQTITEHYDLIVQSDLSIAALGPLTAEEQGSMEVGNAQFSAGLWESAKNIEPIPPINTFNDEWFYEVNNISGYDRTASDNAMMTLLSKAKTVILGSHRDTRVKFEAPLNPLVDLIHTVSLTTSHLEAKGKVCSVVFTLDPGAGKASMEVQLAISGVAAGGVQVEIPLAAPTPPILPSPEAQAGHTLTSLMGSTTTSPFPQPSLNFANKFLALGYHGNQMGTDISFDPDKPYTNSFRVFAPEIPASSVDPVTVSPYIAFATTLNGAIDASQTAVTFHGVPSSTMPYRVQIDNEVIIVLSAVGTTMTVTRSVDGTSAASHADGASVNTTAQTFKVIVPQDTLILTGG